MHVGSRVGLESLLYRRHRRELGLPIVDLTAIGLGFVPARVPVSVIRVVNENLRRQRRRNATVSFGLHLAKSILQLTPDGVRFLPALNNSSSFQHNPKRLVVLRLYIGSDCY